MNKYVAIFCLPADGVKDWMANTDEKTRKEQTTQVMKEWETWKESHKDSLVDAGMPLGKTKRATKDGVTDVVNDLNWLMIVQAESHQAAAELVQTNPHIQMIPGSYVEVMDANFASGM
ncbi:MAG: hypothetical protein ABIT47_03965 [Candidatus Paceibacterota bacterium]